MNPEKIGKFICELRKGRNLSQYQLADMIPISRQAVSKWERGVTTPDTQVLIQLSELFNVTIDELLRGERIENPSIKDLEETTLSILDDSNKKTKKIKRISTISIFIIAILLLIFLSYYFINSYNTMEVYKIGNTNDKFTTTNGVFIITSEKYYLKLGNIKNKIDADIKNIKLYYKKGDKKITIVQDKDIGNIFMMASYGYKTQLTRKDVKTLKDNLYLEITYNENEKETIKLRYKKDYNNDSLFFLQKPKELIKENKKEEKVEEVKQEEKKEEEKKEEEKKEEKPVIQENTQTNQPSQQQTQAENTTEITNPKEQIINKIKEKCPLDMGSYMCDFDNSNIFVIYYEEQGKITLYKGFNLVGDYHIDDDNYACMQTECKTEFENVINDYILQ